MKQQIHSAVNNDPTTIGDAREFFNKWGEYPIGYKPPTRPMTFQELKKKMREQHKRFAKRKPSPPPAVVRVVTHPDRTMLAINEFHLGYATWKYDLGAWTCIKADKCLEFLLRRPQGEAQLELTKRGFSFKWLPK